MIAESVGTAPICEDLPPVSIDLVLSAAEDVEEVTIDDRNDGEEQEKSAGDDEKALDSETEMDTYDDVLSPSDEMLEADIELVSVDEIAEEEAASPSEKDAPATEPDRSGKDDPVIEETVQLVVAGDDESIGRIVASNAHEDLLQVARSRGLIARHVVLKLGRPASPPRPSPPADVEEPRESERGGCCLTNFWNKKELR